MRQPFRIKLAVIFFVVLAGPAFFFIAPPRAHAGGMAVFDASNLVENTLNYVENFLNEHHTLIDSIKNGISAAANVANKASLSLLVVDKYVIKPLAFILSGNVLKAMTSSVVSFVVGKTNGTGAPQFVQNVNGLMQQVGDKQAMVFLAQFARSSNSPFAASIASSLRTNYLQQTSAAGFFAANKCTLSRASPNVNAFLAGNWSQGGIGAWFALTTQPQNNPYTLYQSSQNQLGTLVASAQAASTKALDWGQGVLSWCGDIANAADTSGGSGSVDITDTDIGDGGVTTPNCTKSDGSPGVIKTPGSVILATYNKAVGAEQDKLVAAGEAGSELNAIMGNISSVMKDVNAASKLLGGGAGSFGLAGAAQSSGGNRSVLDQLSTSGFAGATASSVFQTASTLPSSGSDLSGRVTQYQTAWNTITAAANSASSTAATFVKYCSAQANEAGGVADQIKSVLTQATAASATIANANAAVAQVQSDLTAGTDTTADTSTVDLQKLQTMSPTEADVAEAQSQAQSSGVVTTSNASSLVASGLSLVDQMALIELNIQGFESSCLLAHIAQYKAAWDVITAAANSANASITTLLSSCPDKAGAAADDVVKVNSVLVASAKAAQVVAAATSVDKQPLESDVAYAQAQAKAATAGNPPTLFDQVNTANTHVQGLQASCSSVQAP